LRVGPFIIARCYTYAGDIVVFMAEESFYASIGERDPRRYYERFAMATRYIPTPDNHDSMLQGSAVQALARGISEVLERARPE
jgi:hypothetical protein